MTETVKSVLQIIESELSPEDAKFAQECETISREGEGVAELIRIAQEISSPQIGYTLTKT